MVDPPIALTLVPRQEWLKASPMVAPGSINARGRSPPVAGGLPRASIRNRSGRARRGSPPWFAKP